MSTPRALTSAQLSVPCHLTKTRKRACSSSLWIPGALACGACPRVHGQLLKSYSRASLGTDTARGSTDLKLSPARERLLETDTARNGRSTMGDSSTRSVASGRWSSPKGAARQPRPLSRPSSAPACTICAAPLYPVRPSSAPACTICAALVHHPTLLLPHTLSQISSLLRKRQQNSSIP